MIESYAIKRVGSLHMPKVQRQRLEKTQKERNRKHNKATAWYNSARWRTVRDLHLQRQPTCQRCGETGRAGRLNVHHIDGRNGTETDYALDREDETPRLETVCVRCHNREHNRWLPRSSG